MADGRKEPKSKYTLDRGMPGAFEGETVTRRRLMTLTAHGAGIDRGRRLRAARRSASPPARRSSTARRRPGRPSARPTTSARDSYVPRVITAQHGIGQVGKTTAYVRKFNPEIDSPPNPPGIESEFIALSTRCMHLGCPVRYIQAAQRFVCPCHGGVYDFRGDVSGGPPVRPLDHFYTRVRNGQVEIGPRYSVNSEFRRFPSYRDPGEDLDGIGQYMYPGRFSTPKKD